ncbi:hypothetical protein KAI12_01955 [Candidatus Bathyarchaeota archaeon]|nr:hypothetical protein [Candidatus Bathyarchaeota archaeon]
MVTKGQRRLGRTIRNLQRSVELSSKESLAKELEKKYKEKAQKLSNLAEDSPIQRLGSHLIRPKDSTEP